MPAPRGAPIAGPAACSGTKLPSGCPACLTSSRMEGAGQASSSLGVPRAWNQEPIPSLDPLDYRGLALLSKFYRLYTSIRLRHLAPWVKGWQAEDVFAGTTAAVGAEDAWYHASCVYELCMITGIPYTGGQH